ncbi:FmdB family zinc ribbon protein [Brachybacterium sp. YJGR34]|uniref:FmdB family zinc ribbon protein n=1 Tax=Brachybacterium sp. YJGR34 TaxID=2059911 RepID=UPI000E0CA655|nr:zinc ribbon domain-containing protein [Brachybacterium sp. YJGR34]
MPLYEFRCANAHRHELLLPMSATERSADCPHCGAPAARLISAPALGRLGSERARLIESTAASAHAPAVVDRVPGARSAPRPAPDPRHARLPRP